MVQNIKIYTGAIRTENQYCTVVRTEKENGLSFAILGLLFNFSGSFLSYAVCSCLYHHLRCGY